MDTIADMPLEVREAVFDSVLQEKAKYQAQQRLIARLTAESQGLVPPTPEPPALAFESVEPSGTVGLYFNAEVAGLALLEVLKTGLSSRGVFVDDTAGRKLTADGRGRDRQRRRLSGGENFSLDNFLVFGVKRGAEDAASGDNLGFDVTSIGLENNLLKF